MRVKSLLLPRLPLLTTCLVLFLLGCGGSGGGGESDFSKVSDQNNPPPASTNSGSANTGSQPIATGSQPIATGSRQTPPSTNTPPTIVGSPRVPASSPPVAALRGLVSTTDSGGVLSLNGYVLVNNTGIAAASGETVTVSVSGNQISALSIDPHLTGTLSEIASDRSSIVVAGQKIALDFATTFDDTSIDALAIGNVVTISGVALQAGVFAASNITQLAPADMDNVYPTDVSGAIDQLDEDQHTFRLGQLAVDYSNSIVSTNMRDGTWIHVRGTAINSYTLLADSIAPLVDSNLVMNALTANSFSITGLLNGVATNQELLILGQRIVINSNTVLNNATVADLLPQSVVAVTGHYDAAVNGVVADKINILASAAPSTP